MAEFNVTTTGTPAVVVIQDLGGWTLTHPVTKDALEEFSAAEIAESADLQAAIDGAEVTVEDASGNPVTDVTAILAGLPVPDDTEIVHDPADNTKQMRIDVGGVTTATTRVATMPDKDITLGTDDDAIHGTVAGEITALTNKPGPLASNDKLIIEDSADSDNKKCVAIGSIPHDLLDGYLDIEHRELNDSLTTTTNLWSADKISSELAAAMQGADIKDSVETVADSNITLSGEQTLNGYLTSGSRVGVIGQTSADENGIYVTAAGAWARATDMDMDSELTQGARFMVGNTTSTKNGFEYICTTSDPIVVGTTPTSWTEVRRLTFGTTGGTAAEGNDSRIPTQDENDALVGTNGTPATGNPYVTDSDPRMTDSRAPTGAAGGDLSGTYPNPTVDDGADGSAIHDDTAGEITAIAAKTAPVGADTLLIEDSGDSDNKKSMTLSDLGGFLRDLVTVGFARNQATPDNIWLRLYNGVPCNLSPYRLPYACTLVAITATTRDNETVDFEVYKNGFVRAGGTPADGNKEAELVFTAENSKSALGLSIAFAAGDEVGVYMRGTDISYPHVQLWFKVTP